MTPVQKCGWVILIVGSFTSCDPVSSRAEVPLEELRTYLSRWAGVGFSGAVVVVDQGRIVLEKGYGLADREAGRPVTTETVFTVGSITKQFTAAAILVLESENRLRATDTIDRYLEEVPADKAEITIHHLLTHTSGLARGLGDDFDLEATAEWLLRRAMATPLASRPGEQYRYSNLGYSLLGLIIESVSGEPYERFLHERLFGPAGMTRTGYLLPGFRSSELAVGYAQAERWGTVLGRPMLEDGPCWNLRANGGLHTTVGDMARWYLALSTGEALASAAQEKFLTPFVDLARHERYGYGWKYGHTDDGTAYIGHGGTNGVFFAELRLYPEQQRMIFVATNAERTATEAIAAVEAVLWRKDPVQPPETIALTPGRLAEYRGTYRNTADESITVTPGFQRLRLEANTPAASELLAGASPEDRHLAQLADQSMALIVEELLAGGVQALHRAMREEVPLEDLQALQRSLRSTWDEEFGAFEGWEPMSPLIARGQVVTRASLRFERVTDYFHLMWEHGRVRRYAFLGTPLPHRTEVDAFAVSESRFAPFDPEIGVAYHVDFERGRDPAGPQVSLVLAIGDERFSRVSGE